MDPRSPTTPSLRSWIPTSPRWLRMAGREFVAWGLKGRQPLGHEVEGGGAIPLLEKRKICFDKIVSTKKSK